MSALPIAVAGVLVLVRSYIFVAHEHAHFDSDQAIVGLMARHLAHFEAFPLFFYGQQYLLGVEAWIAAPFLLVLGTSVAALKLPLLLINLVVAGLLVRLLVDEEGLAPWQALAASVFFVVPPVITASRLLEAQGANIEPFLYVLLLWILRGRPVAFGVVFGIGVLHREFTAYAVVALLVRAAWRRTLFTRSAFRMGVRGAAAAVLVWTAVLLLAPLASNSGAAARPRGLQSVVLADVPRRMASLVTENVAVLVGVRRDPLERFNITSTLHTGHAWLAVLLAAALAAAAARLALHLYAPPTAPPAPSSGFAAYLALIGVQALVTHGVVSGGGDMLIRYTLLGLLLPIALLAAWMRRETSLRVRWTILAGIGVWSGAMLEDHAALLREYAVRRPPNVYRELAETLIDRRVTAGRAEYWTAYHVSFLTAERVALDATLFSRIASYRARAAETHPDHAVYVSDVPCPGGHQVRRWYLCAP